MMLNKNVKSLETALDDIGFGKFQIILNTILCMLITSDAIEIMTLSFLGPILTCYWHINMIEQSLLASLLFIGMFIGGILMGNMSDRFGRKPLMLICAALLILHGLLGVGAPTLHWMLLCRFMIGLSIAGIILSMVTLASEVLPTKSRANGIFFSFFLFPFGSAFITLIYLVTVNTVGWRIFLLISNIPMIVTLPFLFWLPESPRYLLLSGRRSEAVSVVNRIARLNNMDEIDDLKQIQEQTHSVTDLWHPNYRVTSAILMVLWATCGLSYYGGIILISILNTIPRACLQNMTQIYVGIPDVLGTDDSCCKKVELEGSIDTFISIAGEFLLSPLLVLFVNKFGRKFTLKLFFLVTASTYFMLNFCMPLTLYRVIIFFIRGISNVVFNAMFIYTPEVFPTSVRSFGVGICNGFARIGATSGPFIINLLMINTSFLVGTLVFVLLNLLCFLLVFLLPYETKNRQMCHTAQDDPAIYHTDMGYTELKAH